MALTAAAALVSMPQATTGNGDALGFERGDQLADIHHHVDQQQIGAASGAERGQRDLDGGGVGDLGAALHGELGGFAQLPFEGSDDQQSH